MPRLLRSTLLFVFFATLSAPAQQVTLSGLRAQNGVGAFHGIKQDATGNLYTLFAAGDGVRLLKFNATGTQLLAQTQIGASGDAGIALDLDSTGNIYIAGTSTSLGSVTGTAGTAFPSRADSTTNSFVAKFSPTLAEQWLTFCGSGKMAIASVAATPTSVLVTGSIFAATLPVTSGGIQQSPASGSGGNGFIESFSSTAGMLQYATYLTGFGGDTTPAAIAADAAGNAYVAGTTTATGYPTTAALVPIFRAPGSSTVSGFVTKLDAAGDGFLFSTFIPGNGLTSIAFDSSGSGSILASGNIAAGLFPLTVAQAPIAAPLSYQTAIRMALDGSAVLSSTLLAPAAESFIASGTSGSAWVFTDASATNLAPLLPVTPVETLGNGFALRIASTGDVDRAARFGGLTIASSLSASLPVTAGGVTVAASGTPTLVGSAAPTLSSSLLPTERYDLPFVAAPGTALPSTVRDALPLSTCNGSACSGSAALLAQLAPDAATPSLALSTDALPNLTLRNIGTAAATGLQISATSYTVTTSCGTSLAPAAECTIVLSGAGPGSVTVSASNAGAFTTSLAAAAVAADPIAVLPRELDFGIQTSASAAGTRTVTITNLGSTTQTFTSANLALSNSKVTTPYTLTEASSTCTPATDGVSKILAPGGTCTITLQLAASSTSSNDGVINAHWKIASTEILVTAYAQAAATSLSATTIDFGRQYTGGLRTGRYLYLSNASDAAQSHTQVTSSNPSFTVTDECPATLQPRSICRIALSYQSGTAPSSDALSLGVDGITTKVLGETLPQPSIGAASANPNLTVSPTTVTFVTAVAVTKVSSETQTVVLGNTGATPFAVTLATTGDFAFTTDCGVTLAGGTTCHAFLTFTPSAPGTRQGLLSVTAGSSSPVYVALTGTALAILPANTGTITFGDIPVGTPSVQWFKVAQSFSSFTAASGNGSYTAILIEDSGYGHGTPLPSAFSATATGTCFNCYLGIRFLPATPGQTTGTLTLSSAGGGKSEVITVTGDGAAITGPILTPATQDFGTVAVNSTSGTLLVQLTNGGTAALTASAVSITGDFSASSTVTGGASCTAASLAPGASCFVALNFKPTASGARSGTLSITTSSGVVTSTLMGTGSDDPGIAFSPTSLTFNNTPASTSTQQAIVVTNTGTQSAFAGTATVSDPHFTVTTTCGTLAPAATCIETVTYLPTSAAASGVLTLPIITAPAGAPTTTNYAIPLNGLYTSVNAGLQIIPGESATVNFGSAVTGTTGSTRILHVNNTTATSLTITTNAPRQFAVTASTCSALAANASCDLAVTYTPFTGGDTTGTLFLQGQPSDGSATRNGLGYLQGYGVSSGGNLQIAGNISPLGVLSFGQIASGQTTKQTVTLTNPVTATGTVTVRRVVSAFPFLSTTSCGAPLAPGQGCTITITYAPIFQATAATTPEVDTGSLTIESDAANTPLFVNLTGQATPAIATTPVNTAPLASFTSSQGSLTFPVTAVGTASAAQTVTIANTGTQVLHIFGLITQPSFAATSTCSTLAAGAACTVSVSYQPQTTGTTLGSLGIQSDSGSALEFVSLLGTAGTASISLTPTSINFGRVLVGSTSAQIDTLTNTGATPITFNGAAVTGGVFSLASSSNVANPCPAAVSTLAAGASCTLPVVFAPTAQGTVYGSLAVSTSATSVPLTVALSGVGTQPQLTVAPTSIAFGNVVVGSSSTMAVTLSNTGTTAIDGLAFKVSAGFSVATSCGVTTINAGAACQVSVTYTPAAAGAATGTLTISSTDPASPLTVPITGTGTAAQTGSFTLTVNGATSASATVTAGSPAAYGLTITPTGGYAGGVALTCTANTTVAYAACSLLPPLLTITTGAQTSTANIATVSATGSSRVAQARHAHGPLLALLPCAALLLAGLRRRRIGSLFVLLTAVLLATVGCGSSADPRIRYVAAGTYTFQVTATSTNAVPVSQAVTLTLVVQ